MNTIDQDKIIQDVMQVIGHDPALVAAYVKGRERMREEAHSALEAARAAINNDPARKNGLFEAAEIVRAIPLTKEESK